MQRVKKNWTLKQNSQREEKLDGAHYERKKNVDESSWGHSGKGMKTPELREEDTNELRND